MKKIFKLLTVLILFLSINSEVKSQTVKDSVWKAKWTLQEVKHIAEKYNLQDSVTMTRHNILLFLSKDEVEKYLQKMSGFYKKRKEQEIFLERTKYVRSYNDYFKLINSTPSVKKGWVDGFGSETKYNDFVKETLKSNWRIYRAENGQLKFFRADAKITKEELKSGLRIDTLPKF